jgi:hypothetical protein
MKEIQNLINSVDHQTLHDGFHSRAVQVMSLNSETATNCC